MTKIKLIVFDLNETLIEDNSWLQLNRAMGVTQAEDDILMDWGRTGVINDQIGQSILCEIYKQRAVPSRKNIQKILAIYTYKKDAKETVLELLKLGYELALISGSIDILVESVAAELGIKRWACNNRFIFDADNMLESIVTVDNDSSYKLNQVQSICRQMNVAITEVLCVGDGANDLELFKATGNGVTFHDSKYIDEAKYSIGELKELVGLLK